MTSDVESCKSCFACLVVQHPWNWYLHPANVHVPPLALYRTYKAETHTLAPASILLYHPFTKQYIQIKDFGDVHLTSPRSYLPRLSLLRAGAWASVPLVRQRSLSILVLGSVSGGRHLPVVPVSVLCLVLTPSLRRQRALSLTCVRWSFSGGPEKKHSRKFSLQQTPLTLSLQDNMTRWFCLM